MYDDENKYIPSFPLDSNAAVIAKYATLFDGTENVLIFLVDA